MLKGARIFGPERGKFAVFRGKYSGFQVCLYMTDCKLSQVPFRCYIRVWYRMNTGTHMSSANSSKTLHPGFSDTCIPLLFF